LDKLGTRSHLWEEKSKGQTQVVRHAHNKVPAPTETLIIELLECSLKKIRYRQSTHGESANCYPRARRELSKTRDWRVHSGAALKLFREHFLLWISRGALLHNQMSKALTRRFLRFSSPSLLSTLETWNFAVRSPMFN
jgi:hypothetical protein